MPHLLFGTFKKLSFFGLIASTLLLTRDQKTINNISPEFACTKSSIVDKTDSRYESARWLYQAIDELSDDSKHDESYNISTLRYIDSSYDFDWNRWLDLPKVTSCKTGPQKYRISGDCINNDFVASAKTSKKGEYTEITRRFIGESYMKYHSLPPDRIMFLGEDIEGIIVKVKPSNRKVNLGTSIDLVSLRFNVDFFNFTKQHMDLLLSREEFVLKRDSVITSINDQKYFFEANLIGSATGTHFDWRFFKRTTYSDWERKHILSNLVNSWFKFCRLIEMKSWLAHGTLLGWSWNRQLLPWDTDIDVQISTESLYQLISYNQTLLVDIDDFSLHTYLLDVGAPVLVREKGGGMNTIDARFIDVQNGFYIDITALSFTESCKKMAIDTEGNTEFKMMLIEKGENDQISQLEYSLERARLYSEKAIYNCKNDHFYNINELQLKETIFEGRTVYVPKGWSEILRREYPNGRNNKYRDWEFDLEWRKT